MRSRQIITTEIDVDTLSLSKYIKNEINNLLDEELMTAIHSAFERYCNPYVPFLNGPLSQTTNVSASGVEYIQPYAHYQYMGVNFNHTIEYHPKATALWDKVMMSEKGDEFLHEVEELIKMKARQMYG